MIRVKTGMGLPVVDLLAARAARPWHARTAQNAGREDKFRNRMNASTDNSNVSKGCKLMGYHVAPEIEQRILDYGLNFPTHGRQRVSNEVTGDSQGKDALEKCPPGTP